ncbi:MAG: DUF1134 domain-containing protein [Sphingomonas sp.]|uniref:DUF1134 domain-containing protein n=1 Tax=Sphingomonas sp. TaxID=28214 RepID=UPI0025F8B5D0|nr:DUF1134 domain-containing protein [Sphingomonas sp.]MBY0284601.1 DUF1134 domain-containing protein [Sphingomonas sp.]
MKKFAQSVGLALLIATMGTATVAAQVRTVDPNTAIDSDIARPQTRTPAPAPPPAEAPRADTRVTPPVAPPPAPANAADPATGATAAAATYQRKDLLSASEGVFGKGAQGLAGILEKVLRDQGEPNAYIAGREASGAFVVGLRYGSGILSHRVEGDRPIYWTGPSVGFDLGGNASKVFVLVYNLYDSQEIYRRFPEGEGHLYFVGGFSATYLRRGNTVLIPIRLGVGARAGVNIGYMKFSEKARWLPF